MAQDMENTAQMLTLTRFFRNKVAEIKNVLIAKYMLQGLRMPFDAISVRGNVFVTREVLLFNLV